MNRSFAELAALVFSVTCAFAQDAGRQIPLRADAGLKRVAAEAEAPGAAGDAVIRAPFRGSEIVITTTSRLAGAIHAIHWNGREFIDSADHGRQLQSASSFDSVPPENAETFNPTEAGSRLDGAGPRSTSRLLAISASRNELRTRTQMAFWLAPGERSDGRLARNDRLLSNHCVEKRVRIGVPGLPNVIDYAVTFTVPEGEPHTTAQFEALTGYMPADFQRFWKFDPVNAELRPLDDGPGEQPLPVVFSTPEGLHAMGVISHGRVPAPASGPSYGRFRFARERVTKWNCVFRIRPPGVVKPGEYRYRMFVALGTLADVQTALTQLARETSKVSP